MTLYVICEVKQLWGNDLKQCYGNCTCSTLQILKVYLNTILADNTLMKEKATEVHVSYICKSALCGNI